MNALTRNDLSVIEGDARVIDKHLKEVLGYSEIGKVHAIIRRHHDELESFGEVFAHVSKNPSPKGGRPSYGYYLNEEQALLICIMAQTKQARAARTLGGVCKVGQRHDPGYLHKLRHSAGHPPFPECADCGGGRADLHLRQMLRR